MKTILITGTAGFIGYHLTDKLLADNQFVVAGIDSVNDYYDPRLKADRLKNLGIQVPGNIGQQASSDKFENFDFYRADIAEREYLSVIFNQIKPDIVVHLAAQAGVRFSLSHPEKYIRSNITGFFNVMDLARKHSVEHFVYASSSSVYGLNEKMPLAVSDNVDHPISLYAATKKSNELLAHSYSHLYKLPTTGLRFFTVYGPWGRPDMAYYKFSESILNNRPIEVYNNGDMYRDFTYIDDIIEGVKRVIDQIPSGNENWDPVSPDPSSSRAPYRVFNIGNHTPVKLIDFIHALEDALGYKAHINYLPMQPGDVYKTFADVDQLQEQVGYTPSTPLETGLGKFAEWFRNYRSA